jgi:monoamine oxidase
MYDTIVIGAGAAGLAAARTLAEGGRAVLVLEAPNRIGGRVWTDHAIGPLPVELGAEFIHGAYVSTWRWVRRTGAESLPFGRWSGRWLALGDGRLAGAWLLRLRPDLRRLQALERDLAAYHGPERSLADWLGTHDYSPLAPPECGARSHSRLARCILPARRPSQAIIHPQFMERLAAAFVRHARSWACNVVRADG